MPKGSHQNHARGRPERAGLMEITQNQIDAGAEALRQIEQGGRLLRRWADLPNNDKRKWREKAEIVIRAAFPVNETITDMRTGLPLDERGWPLEE